MKVKLIKEAFLNCVLMDVDGLALLNCFNELSIDGYERTEFDHAIAILNVGSSCTNLAIIGNSAVPFVRDIAYAGDDIIKHIAAENKISTEVVHKALFDDESSEYGSLQLGDNLAKACQKLIVEVDETLRYYTAQEKSDVVDKIFVCGGFALVKGFVELLNNRLSADAVLWNPFEKIRCDAGLHCREMLQKKGPAMAVAAGLAVRSI